MKRHRLAVKAQYSCTVCTELLCPRRASSLGPRAGGVATQPAPESLPRHSVGVERRQQLVFSCRNELISAKSCKTQP